MLKSDGHVALADSELIPLASAIMRNLFLALLGLGLIGPILSRANEPDWVDPSPHKILTVQNKGVSFECLDWEGTGETMLLLAGLGSSGHIYDDFAAKFTDRFRVVALTRRGLGKSDKPTEGYDMATLVDDIRQSLDTLGIKHAVVVGHSFGAVEAAVFARSHPDRVSKVVYLDGAYAPSAERLTLMRQAGPLMPSPTQDQASSFASLLEWLRTNHEGWNNACEADMRTMMLSNPADPASQPPASAFRALMDTASSTQPEFAKVTVPALAIFADDRAGKLMAALDPVERTADREILSRLLAFHHQGASHFRQTVDNATVIEMADTNHDCFVQREAEVVRVMRKFLAVE